MKGFTFLVSVCLITALIALVACDSDQSTPKLGTGTMVPFSTSPQKPEGVPSSTRSVSTAVSAPAATASSVDYGSTAPPFEVIAATEKSIMGCDTRSISTPQIRELNDYGRRLEGKIVQGQGWVESVEPDERLLKQLNELDTYNYDVSILTIIDNPNIGEAISIPLIVGVTRQEAGQFVLWHDSTKRPPYEKVQFAGKIANAVYDPTFHSLMIAVDASTATLGTGLGVPYSTSQQTSEGVATQSPCPSPSTKVTASADTATPAATVGNNGDKKPAPPFDVISATVKNIIGDTIPIHEQQLQALAGFSRSLRGKSVNWQGWVETIWPNKGYLQQHNELNTYSGGIDVYIFMDNPNTETDKKPVGGVVMESVPLQQAEQLVLWLDPAKSSPYEKVQFAGTIELAYYDPTSAQLTIFVISPTVTLAK